MIVVDANIISFLFIKGDKSDQVEAAFAINHEWIAPVLLNSILRKSQKNKELPWQPQLNL
jgi:hypothetical protein